MLFPSTPPTSRSRRSPLPFVRLNDSSVCPGNGGALLLLLFVVIPRYTRLGSSFLVDQPERLIEFRFCTRNRRMERPCVYRQFSISRYCFRFVDFMSTTPTPAYINVVCVGDATDRSGVAGCTGYNVPLQ